MFTHMCLRGNPGIQLLLWTGGFAAILSCVTDWKVAALGALILSIAMGTLCFQYVDMVHRHECTGNPGNWENRQLTFIVGRVQKTLLDNAAKDASAYPAGWLLESHFIDKNLKDTLAEPSQQAEAFSFWHTSFTHLWERKVRRVALWYPGGTLSDASSHLEWREYVMPR
jgi:hypothetical protein